MLCVCVCMWVHGHMHTTCFTGSCCCCCCYLCVCVSLGHSLCCAVSLDAVFPCLIVTRLHSGVWHWLVLAWIAYSCLWYDPHQLSSSIQIPLKHNSTNVWLLAPDDLCALRWWWWWWKQSMSGVFTRLLQADELTVLRVPSWLLEEIIVSWCGDVQVNSYPFLKTQESDLSLSAISRQYH